MSIEAATQFLQKAQSDQALQAKLQAVSTGTEEQSRAEVIHFFV